jgi:hypothetical protein
VWLLLFFYWKESHKWGTFFLNNIGVGTRMDDELKEKENCKITGRKIPSVFWRIIHNTFYVCEEDASCKREEAPCN